MLQTLLDAPWYWLALLAALSGLTFAGLGCALCYGLFALRRWYVHRNLRDNPRWRGPVV
jgi:hypothetical protein